MPIAAVPKYLGQDFQQASPGLRFGMYLKLWGINRRTKKLLWTTHDLDYEVRGQQRQEREVKKENKVSALSDARRLTDNDKRVINALAARQSALAATVPLGALLRLEAIATAPFTTGLGNEHPLENGFAFLNPYGLPYLPGSGVKGVLRQAARELASGAWGESHGWSTEKAYTLTVGDTVISLSMLDVLFGREAKDGDSEHVRGVLSFWDVIPQIEGDSLMVEVMTPHQSHYYQRNRERKSDDSDSPHDSGQPTPIFFLTVPPGSTFTFYVVCDLAHLGRIAPDLAENEHWKTLLSKAFLHVFEWLGFGAKTSIGYGAMQQKPTSSRAEPETPSLSGEEVWPNAVLEYQPNTSKVIASLQGNKTAPQDAHKVFQQLGAERSERLKKRKKLSGIAVKVRRQNNFIELVELLCD